MTKVGAPWAWTRVGSALGQSLGPVRLCLGGVRPDSLRQTRRGVALANAQGPRFGLWTARGRAFPQERRSRRCFKRATPGIAGGVTCAAPGQGAMRIMGLVRLAWRAVQYSAEESSCIASSALALFCGEAWHDRVVDRHVGRGASRVAFVWGFCDLFGGAWPEAPPAPGPDAPTRATRRSAA